MIFQNDIKKEGMRNTYKARKMQFWMVLKLDGLANVFSNRTVDAWGKRYDKNGYWQEYLLK